ncbi:hypothetical protein CJF32_00011286 [Rutstroemia sp. NJR-2017a WRK4]|nr:hypothetical protein CJF32_00011286 [Rutstroemia sp. NJR-2017a WRK4]
MQFQVTNLLLLATAIAPSALAFPTLNQVSMAPVETNITVETYSFSSSTIKERYCHANLHYCEDYHTRISNKLCQIIGDCNYWSGNVWNSLWNCANDLEFMGLCGGENSCQDGGAGRSDHCKAS